MNGRRDFLRQLVALPLVGGGLELIGQPTAVAAPVTYDLIEAYKTWLSYEHRMLSYEMASDPLTLRRYGMKPPTPNVPPEVEVQRADYMGSMLLFVGKSGSYHHTGRRPPPSTRAALVLSTVGCDWHDRERIFG